MTRITVKLGPGQQNIESCKQFQVIVFSIAAYQTAYLRDERSNITLNTAVQPKKSRSNILLRCPYSVFDLDVGDVEPEPAIARQDPKQAQSAKLGGRPLGILGHALFLGF